VVYSDDRLFAMFTMHNKNRLEKKTEKELDKVDCWFVHYAAGDVNRLSDILPYDLDWIAFDRGKDKPLKFYKLSRIRRLFHGKRQ